ncbi:MAG: hypothetical protein HDR17_02590 [Lachnospiraceae bacterium]|nr:hypothetical protein [Lachnospiraceae bacterium]MBD5505495.1 hypothetical protein [Lachnospiraceae bacterium]
MKPTNKNEEIKIRVTAQEKKQLKKLSAPSKSMSAYILERALSTKSDIQNAIIDTVEALDLLNKIISEIEKSTDDSLKGRIRNIVEGRIKNGR